MRVTNRRRPPRLCDGRYRAPGDAASIRPGPRPSLCGRRATIRRVFFTGKQIVRDGKVLAFDYRDARARLQMAQQRAIQKVPGSRLGRARRRRDQGPDFPIEVSFRPSSD